MSVALPVSVPSRTLTTESDLARQAVRGHRDAFEELYRRHASSAWRLAAAVAPDRDRAAAAVSEGFVRALRVTRRHAADDAFRTSVLAGVYRTVLDQVRHAPEPTARTAGAGESAVQTAFLSLPERWRAALWLSEVESADAGRVAAVLGTSTLVASQLADRGRRGLASRLGQSGVALPAAVGAALRPLADAVPAHLEADAAGRWRRAVVADPSTRLAPLTAWMGERAARNLGVAAGGLFALGLIGLGVLNQTTAGTGVSAVGTPGAPSATGTLPALGAPGAPRTGSTPGSVAPPTGTVLPGSARLTTASAGSAVLTSALVRSLDAVPVTTSRTTGATPGSGAVTTTTPPATVTGRAGHGTATNPTKPKKGTHPSGGTHPTPPKSPSPPSTSTGGGSTTVVSVPGVASVSTSSGGATVTVGNPTAPVAQVTTCPTGAGVSVLGITVPLGCPTPTTSASGGSSGSSGSGSSGSGSSGSAGSGTGSSGSGSSGSAGSGSSGSGSSGSGSGSSGSGGSGSSGSGSGSSGSGGSGSSGSGSGSSGSGSSGSGSGSGSGSSGSGSSGSGSGGGLLGGLGGVLGGLGL